MVMSDQTNKANKTGKPTKADNPWGDFLDDLQVSLHKVDPKKDVKGGPKVLVIDDSNVVRNELRHILSVRSCTVVEAVDGVDGLAKLAAHPDVVLAFCDVNMPNLSGLEMVEKVATEVVAGRLKRVPIVMLTTESSKDKVVRAKSAGVLGWIIKPAKREHILQLFDRFVSKASAA